MKIIKINSDISKAYAYFDYESYNQFYSKLREGISQNEAEISGLLDKHSLEIMMASQDKSKIGNEYTSFSNLLGLFTDTIDYYNPVSMLVQILSTLVIGRGYKFVKHSSILDKLKNKIDLDSFNSHILKELILTRSVGIEIIDNKLIIHDLRNVTVELNEFNELMYVEIRGYKNVFIPETKLFEYKLITKEYYNVDNYKKLLITDEHGIVTETDLKDDIIPFVFYDKGSFDIRPLFNLLDLFNEYMALSRNTLRINGNPILYSTSNISTDNDDNKKFFSTNFKSLRTINLNDIDGKIGFLECTNKTIASLDNMMEKTKKMILVKFPELSLTDILSGTNISTQSLRMKLTSLLTKIQYVRNDFNLILKDLFYKLAVLNNKKISDKTVIKITFSDLISAKNEVDTVNELIALRGVEGITIDELRNNLPDDIAINGTLHSIAKPKEDVSSNVTEPLGKPITNDQSKVDNKNT